MPPGFMSAIATSIPASKSSSVIFRTVVIPSSNPQVLLDPLRAQRRDQLAKPRPPGLPYERLVQLGEQCLGLGAVRLREVEYRVVHGERVHRAVKRSDEPHRELAGLAGGAGLVLEAVVVRHEVLRHPLLDVRLEVPRPFGVPGEAGDLVPVAVYLVVKQDV